MVGSRSNQSHYYKNNSPGIVRVPINERFYSLYTNRLATKKSHQHPSFAQECCSSSILVLVPISSWFHVQTRKSHRDQCFIRWAISPSSTDEEGWSGRTTATRIMRQSKKIHTKSSHRDCIVQNEAEKSFYCTSINIIPNPIRVVIKTRQRKKINVASRSRCRNW